MNFTTEQITVNDMATIQNDKQTLQNVGFAVYKLMSKWQNEQNNNIRGFATYAMGVIIKYFDEVDIYTGSPEFEQHKNRQKTTQKSKKCV